MDLDATGLFDTNFEPYKFPAGKIILCGVPGAFTPGCTQKHLPGFVKSRRLLDIKGYKVIFMAVTDGCVMEAWNKHHGHPDIEVVADPLARFSKNIGMDHDYGESMGVRCKRFALLIEDGKIVKEFKKPWAEDVIGEL